MLWVCNRQLTWSFDLDGIAEMYRSYESASLWGFLQKHADGIHISFVRAEHSTFRWAGQVTILTADRILSVSWAACAQKEGRLVPVAILSSLWLLCFPPS